MRRNKRQYLKYNLTNNSISCTILTGLKLPMEKLHKIEECFVLRLVSMLKWKFSDSLRLNPSDVRLAPLPVPVGHLHPCIQCSYTRERNSHHDRKPAWVFGNHFTSPHSTHLISEGHMLFRGRYDSLQAVGRSRAQVRVHHRISW